MAGHNLPRCYAKNFRVISIAQERVDAHGRTTPPRGPRSWVGKSCDCRNLFSQRYRLRAHQRYARRCRLHHLSMVHWFQGFILLPLQSGSVSGSVAHATAICGSVVEARLRTPGRLTRYERAIPARHYRLDFLDRAREIGRWREQEEIDRSPTGEPKRHSPYQSICFKDLDPALDGIGRLLTLVADCLLRWPSAPMLVGIVRDRPKRGLLRRAARPLLDCPVDCLMAHVTSSG
jgi:hypothetical protein